MVHVMTTINLDQPVTHCPLCKRSNRYAQLSRKRATTSAIISAVRLYYASSYMTDEDTHEWYASGEYRQILSGAPGLSDELVQSESDHAAQIAPLIYERVYRYAKILDIGCSSACCWKSCAITINARRTAWSGPGACGRVQ